MIWQMEGPILQILLVLIGSLGVLYTSVKVKHALWAHPCHAEFVFLWLPF